MARSIRNTGKPRPLVARDEPAEAVASQIGEFVPVTSPCGEELVTDARHGVTPRQMVDRKVVALLGGGNPGLVAQAQGGPSDPRRTPEARP